MDSSGPRRSSRALTRSASVPYYELNPSDKVFTPLDTTQDLYEPASPLSSPASADNFTELDTPVKATKTRKKRKVQDTDLDGESAVAGKKNMKTKAYHNKDVQAHKPAPFGSPPVHSGIRQSLCEAVPYYRSHQSGTYTQNKVVYGFLCDKEASIRAKFTTEVMIATTGGGKVQDAKGNMIQGTHNMGNTASMSFINTMNAKTPVAVIAGQGNPISPTKLPAYYCVLGWFHVTDVWCEESAENTKDGVAFKRWMCRLEKIDLSTISWWAPKGSPNPPLAPDFGTKVNVQQCLTCGKDSKEIYDAGWACLNPVCRLHFVFESPINHQTLNLNPAFVNERTQYTGVAPDPLIPAVPSVSPSVSTQIVQASSELAKAIVCPNCHNCIEKIFWNSWACDKCQYSLSLALPPVTAANAILGNSKSPKTMVMSGVTQAATTFGRYTTDIYMLPDDLGNTIGFVVHMKSNDFVNQQPGGPDELFETMQSDKLDLKRGTIKGKKGGVTQMLTAHYAANWGAPYKWHVKHDTIPFADTPDAILSSLNRLTWAGKQATGIHDATRIGGDYLPPNEVLSVGYKVHGKMGWHDDGEKELGPTVASLSLGCSATMAWRQKVKLFGDRRSNQSKPMPDKGGNPTCLKIVLNHGDIMVMHGSAVQKFYEHEVVPLGNLRFAITARRVNIALLSARDQAVAEAAGTIPPHRELPPYDGDAVFSSRISSAASRVVSRAASPDLSPEGGDEEESASQADLAVDHGSNYDDADFIPNAQDDADSHDDAGNQDGAEVQGDAEILAQPQSFSQDALEYDPFGQDGPDVSLFDQLDALPGALDADAALLFGDDVQQYPQMAFQAHQPQQVQQTLQVQQADELPSDRAYNLDGVVDQIKEGQVTREVALRAAMELVHTLTNPNFK